MFHFNPHWGGESRMGRRHCGETLGPFLRILRDTPSWRTTIEISGAGLESIQSVYPEQIRLLRNLVESGQVELISSLYTPGLWIGFPHRDLIRSVERNRQCLAKLGFPWTRIFFAQEAFFGIGVSALSDYFDIVVCKDDYLQQQISLIATSPCFTLAGMKVVIASNHLLNELAGAIRNNPGMPEQYDLTVSHVQHLLRVREISDSNNFPCAYGSSGDIEYLWYHCGDGNHVTAIYKPADLQYCYYDPVWAHFCVSQVLAYEGRGYRFTQLGEFANTLDYSVADELPALIEGSWNPQGADGVFCWMGRNDTPWEDDAAVLTAISRARTRLVTAERTIDRMHSPSVPNSMHERLSLGWDQLLNAQVSDTMGWNASPQAVAYSLKASDHALLLATQLIEEGGAHIDPPCEHLSGEVWPEGQDHLDLTDCPVPEIFGVDGHSSLTRINRSVCLCECIFQASAGRFGIRFPFSLNEIVFCPSGLETAPTRIDLNGLKTDCPTLPLANGLIQVANEIFLIKNTSFVHVACRINRGLRVAEFAIERGREPNGYRWQFYIVRGALEYAVKIANLVNYV